MSNPVPATPAGQRPDENARRLIVLRRYLDLGFSVATAVKATNEYFKKLRAKRAA